MANIVLLCVCDQKVVVILKSYSFFNQMTDSNGGKALYLGTSKYKIKWKIVVWMGTMVYLEENVSSITQTRMDGVSGWMGVGQWKEIRIWFKRVEIGRSTKYRSGHVKYATFILMRATISYVHVDLFVKLHFTLTQIKAEEDRWSGRRGHYFGRRWRALVSAGFREQEKNVGCTSQNL